MVESTKMLHKYTHNLCSNIYRYDEYSHEPAVSHPEQKLLLDLVTDTQMRSDVVNDQNASLYS